MTVLPGATIYLDYAASTPVADEVAEAMAEALRALVANPAAGTHAPGGSGNSSSP